MNIHDPEIDDVFTAILLQLIEIIGLFHPKMTPIEVESCNMLQVMRKKMK